MGFQDVAFLPSELVFPPHFLGIAVDVNASGPPYVLKLWFGCKQGHAPCKIPLLQQNHFLRQSNFIEIIRLLQI